MVAAVTVSTITTIAAASFGTGIAIFAILMLIGFLAGKELLGASSGNKQKLIARSLNISIIPLLIGFVIIVGLKVAEILA
jgi:hypothetical protein